MKRLPVAVDPYHESSEEDHPESDTKRRVDMLTHHRQSIMSSARHRASRGEWPPEPHYASFCQTMMLPEILMSKTLSTDTGAYPHVNLENHVAEPRSLWMLHPLPPTFHSLQYSCEGVTGAFRQALHSPGSRPSDRPKSRGSGVFTNTEDSARRFSGRLVCPDEPAA